MPNDFGTHHCWNRSALVNASNTRRAGALTVRVTTSSRSDLRSAVVRFFTGAGSLSLLASIELLLGFELFDDLVQLVETGGPELSVGLEPGGLRFQPMRAERAGAHPSDLLGGHQPRLLQDPDVLLHPGEGHLE